MFNIPVNRHVNFLTITRYLGNVRTQTITRFNSIARIGVDKIST